MPLSHAILHSLFHIYSARYKELFMQSKYSLSFRIVEFIFRIIGLIVGCFWGWQFGGWALDLFGSPSHSDLLVTKFIFFLVGVLSGCILILYFTTRSAMAIGG